MLTDRSSLRVCMVLLTIFACSVTVSAQSNASSDSLGRQRDIVDAIQRAFKPGSPIRSGENNKKLTQISVAPAFGYTLQTGLAGIITGNALIQSSKYPSQNISAINSYLAYTQYNQLLFNTESTIWTDNNKYNLIGDWRLLRYPSENYGLGSTTSINDHFTINYNYLRLHEAVLRNIGRNWYAGLGYQFDYHWGISESGVDTNKGATDFDRYGFRKNSISSGITLNLLQDTRTNPVNPRGGWYGKLVVRNNFTWLGSNSNWQSLLIDARKYIPVNHGKQVLALWSYNWFTLHGNPPYLDMPSLGWDTYNNTGRGYIQSRFQGKNMLYDEAEYRFNITANGLLGAVLFTNMHSFSQWPGGSFEKLNVGYGGGLRIKLNKFSNTNIAIDYGLGFQGSRGLFVNLGEVF
ncbi:BamA/TamA family outer membrane protein [Deminuibacter soli]|uniref:Bacterial surface antigen (D15) domain-containing protein n=1 Tax=Deminuibacter soli TaxID=2291815 RepID=A0A3E1NHK3_9BACT|nr:BamA/TamA family outer membrane protein [Deminuibacter soli]RFM27362.1 hypothetical protein DXN05_15195 [Deminuibacter soli]